MLLPTSGVLKVLVFLTNHLALSPATIAAVYKERWTIELDPRRLKSEFACSASAISIVVHDFMQRAAPIQWRQGVMPF